MPNLVTRLFEANRIEPATVALRTLGETPAVAAMLDGRMDAVVFASAPESLLVQMLLQTPGIRLYDFAQAEAYSRRHPFLSPVTPPRGGAPWLRRHLPFWLANLVDRMWVVLVSIIAVLIPLSHAVPPLYEFRVRSRIFRWYARLRDIEESVGDREHPADRLLERLDKLDARVERLTVPLSYADELYALRSHIQMVRDRIGRAVPPAAPPGSTPAAAPTPASGDDPIRRPA